MSVLTKISHSELTSFLLQYNLGQLQTFTGIQEGTVNTNYKLKIGGEYYILTLFEHMDFVLAQQYLQLTAFLTEHQITCPVTIRTREQQFVSTLCGKPACLITYLTGTTKANPSPTDCYQIGNYLAKLHLITLDFQPHLINHMDCQWRTQQAQTILPSLPSDERQQMQQALAIQESIAWENLPKSTIHYDCFRDNVFFQGEQLEGVIDFYYACYDAMVLDLAVAVNDWCTDWQHPQCPLSTQHFEAILAGYQQIRRLDAIEKMHLQPILQVMSFHFWLTRLLTRKTPVTNPLQTQKNPDEYKQVFQRWQNNILVKF